VVIYPPEVICWYYSISISHNIIHFYRSEQTELIGLDIGTTNIKAAAYDRCGALLAEASLPSPSHQEGIRQASTDPLVLVQTVERCLNTLTKQINPQTVAGLAVASVGETGVLLDSSRQPLFPILAWYDERTTPQVNQVNQRIDEAAVYRITGLPSGHTYTTHKLLWLQQEHPEVINRARCWLPVCDWVAHCLGGGLQMGYSQASRTMAFDLKKHSWWDAGLNQLGLPRAIWPELLPESSRIGSISASEASLTGLCSGTPIYLAGHDHVCGALASGVVEPGIVLDSTGTTETELTTVKTIDSLLTQANLSFCLGCHVSRGRYYATGGILGAGSLISWLAELYWPEQGSERGAVIKALCELAASSPMGANGLYVLPHLTGAGSPNRSSTARGVIAGLSNTHTRADVARAAIEGLSYELNVLWDALAHFTDCSIKRAIAVGGGSRNDLWNQIKADITGHTLVIPAHSEAVTRGAALLAGLGAGVYADETEAITTTMQAERTYAPSQSARFYQQHLAYFSRLRELAVPLGRTSGELLTGCED